MIEIENVSRLYQGVAVVDGISLGVPEGQITAIVGTSGSGKTTLLRIINRLIEPSAGRVLIDGVDTATIPAFALRRKIGYVIQGNGLFPHRTVAQNIATVPKLLGWDKARIAKKVDELLALFQLDPAQYRDRMPAELSGGQQQRVGVARALAAEPRLLLMDEPFGALDPIIRKKAQLDLRAIQQRLDTTVVLVTHDIEEAIYLGDRIAVLDKGKLLQCAPPIEIVTRPATEFVGELLGSGDRAFRLLALQPIAKYVEPGVADGAPIDIGLTLRDALEEALWTGRDAVPVADAGGAIVGRLTLQKLADLAARPK